PRRDVLRHLGRKHHAPLRSAGQLGLEALDRRAGAGEPRAQTVGERRRDLRLAPLAGLADRVGEPGDRLGRGLQHAALPLHGGAGDRLGRGQLGADDARLRPDHLGERRRQIARRRGTHGALDGGELGGDSPEPTRAGVAAVGVLGAGHAGRAHQVVRAARVAAGVPGTRVPVVALGVVVTAGRWGDGPVHAVAELGVADVVGAGVLVGRASVYRRWALLLCIAACAAGIAGPGLPLELGTLTAAAARDARGGRVGTLVDLSVAALLHAVLVGAVLIDGAAVGLVLVRADAFRQARVGRARVRVVARVSGVAPHAPRDGIVVTGA